MPPHYFEVIKMNEHINWAANDYAPQIWGYRVYRDDISAYSDPKYVEINMHRLLLRRWNGFYWLDDFEPITWLELPELFNISYSRLVEMRRSPEWKYEVTKFLNFLQLDTNCREFRKVLGCPSVRRPAVSEPSHPEAVDVNIQMTDRKYGIEIEMVSDSSHEEVAEALSNEDIPCRNESWGSPTRTYWKTTTDSSIRQMNYDHAIELISPPLSGVSGLESIQNVCRAINNIGVDVNRTCGLHVHVDADGLEARNIRNVVTAWMRYEPIIDTFLPSSRRSGNGHCHPLPKNNHITLVGARSKRRVERLANPEGRYYKLNLKSLSKHGTLEFRHHSGTTASEKIIRNVQFCLAFVESCMSRVFQPVDTGEWRITEQTDEILETLCESIDSEVRDEFQSYFRNRQEALRIQEV